MRCLLLGLVCSAACADARGQDAPGQVARSDDAPLGACFGEPYPMIFVGDRWVAPARVGTAQGNFIIDTGTTRSKIDPSGFSDGSPPQAVAGTNAMYEAFSLYPEFPQVRLVSSDLSRVDRQLQVAGVVGTDLLHLFATTIDRSRRVMHRSLSTTFCDSRTLRAAGLTPISTKGYYEFDLRRMKKGFPQAPMVPVRIGSFETDILIDSGMTDAVDGHVFVINKLMFVAMEARGLVFEKVKTVISAGCGVRAPVPRDAFQLKSNPALQFVGEDDRPVVSVMNAIFVTPDEGDICSGPESLPMPTGRIGAGVFSHSRLLVLDPFASAIWTTPNVSAEGDPTH